MVVFLTRTYFSKGTNGKLEFEGKLICNTIELPWNQNKKQVSCIPEGKYELKKRYSTKYKLHLEILDVKNRSYILFHPANDAMRELKGCIAPVTKISGPGLGLQSRKAFEKLKSIVFPILEQNEKVYLIISS